MKPCFNTVGATWLLVFVGYYLLGQIAIHLTIMPEGMATFWPPNAIVVAVLILSPFQRWPVILVAGIAAEFAADFAFYPLWQIVGFALVNALEAALAAFLVRRWVLQGQPYGDFNIRMALGLGAVFLFVAPPLAALGGGLIYSLAEPLANYWKLWRMWWFGDAIGLLLMTPLLLVWLGETLPSDSKAVSSRYEWGLMLGLLVFAGGIVFFTPESWPSWLGSPSLLLPLLAWFAVRFGLHGATLAAGLIALMSAAGTTQGRGHFVDASSQASMVLAVQEYLLVVVFLALFLGTAFRQLTWAMGALTKERQSLEARVQERTRELEEARAEAERLSLTDALTGLNNRRAFFQLGKLIEEQSRRTGRSYSIIMLDIDHFKSVNDTYGHAVGDLSLQKVAQQIVEIARSADIVGRIGGEEFAICLPETTIEESNVLAERLRSALSTLVIPLAAAQLKLTCSFGVACCMSHPEETLENVLMRADKALYQAKEKGRDQVIVHGDAQVISHLLRP